MRKWLKRIGIVFLVIVVLIVFGAVVGVVNADSRMNQSYAVAPEALNVAVPTDQASIDEGKRLVAIRDCYSCHGADLGGNVVIDQAPIGLLYAKNLTAGNGGIGKTLKDTDYVRAIRHGLDQNGKPLVGMPSDDYSNISDDDMGRIIAYIRSMPPVDKTTPPRSFTPFAKVLLSLGALGTLPAETIDHSVKKVEAPQAGVSVEYGKYLAQICQGCHRPDFTGGKVQFGPPDAPPAANLTPAGNLANWSEHDFITTIRTGKTPANRQLNEFMPYKAFGQMSDDELKALYLYFKSLPAKATAK